MRYLERLITSRDYSLAHRSLEAADFGAACLLRKTILVAAAPGLHLPEWPRRTHAPASECKIDTKPLPYIGVGTVLREFEPRNPRITSQNSASDTGDFCELGGKPVSHHLTGCHPTMSREDSEGTVADYEAPLDCERHYSTALSNLISSILRQQT
jgi:hypothetical protein